MKLPLSCAVLLGLALPLGAEEAAPTPPLAPIPRLLPPEGIEIPEEVRQRLSERLAQASTRLERLAGHQLRPDVEIFTKAVELALVHGEFYGRKDFAKAESALDEAERRLANLERGESPWTKATGLVVRGYRSQIDGSVQPYGLVIPDSFDFQRATPLYVWLHGRGDKNTDLHFIHERRTKPGQIVKDNAIVVHPFGRHCVGWKHAGEIDVLEVIKDVGSHYRIDESRIVLIGFSMGGAGAWHIGAHYADRWAVVAPGAGFAETARYQKLTPERYPPDYEQTLWGAYDVPNYVRNLFNTETIAYSGELDKQIQAARVMVEAFEREGRTLAHLIGPGVEHKYEEKTLAELLKRIDDVLAKQEDSAPSVVNVQTRTLRYPAVKWVEILALDRHWEDSRVDAALSGPRQVTATTKNVRGLALRPFSDLAAARITIDGQELEVQPEPPRGQVTLVRMGDKWQQQPGFAEQQRRTLAKRHGLQGPIDDAFLSRFLVVAPTGKSRNPRFQAWAEFELAHFRDRWRALMRGELPLKRDVDVTEADFDQNLVLFGDAESNAVIRQLLPQLPVQSRDGKWLLSEKEYDGDRFVPALIYPLRSESGAYQHYVVLNSGLTFREGHDRTNSLQNPKLPDWALIDLMQPPDALAPGRIHDAGFFDESWHLRHP